MRTTILRSRIADIVYGYLAVIVYGYLVVIAVFAVFLALPGLPQLEKLNVTERFVVSIIVVAPVILGFLWNRLMSLKVGEFEFVLGMASPTINVKLASAIQELGGSESPKLVELIKEAIAQEELKLVEVNLTSRPYWWTTRLFLLAALAEKYTNVQRLVFAKNDAQRVFVGMAKPASVRQVLGKQFPSLEEAFTELHSKAGAKTTKQEQVELIGVEWLAYRFRRDSAPVLEREFREEISVQTLCEWLGSELETECQWSEWPPSKRLYATILDCKAPFVPLLIGPRLDKVVDRSQLLERLAIAAIT